MTITKLIKKAEKAAEAWSESDLALIQWQESFGHAFDTRKENLTADLESQARKGLDLNQFQGKETPFRFDDLGAHIVVRVTKVPTPHEELQKVEDEIAELKKQIKVLELQKKAVLGQLTLEEEIKFSVEKVGLAFKRIAK